MCDKCLASAICLKTFRLSFNKTQSGDVMAKLFVVDFLKPLSMFYLQWSSTSRSKRRKAIKLVNIWLKSYTGLFLKRSYAV